jgi:hypothetical protein
MRVVRPIALVVTAALASIACDAILGVTDVPPAPPSGPKDGGGGSVGSGGSGGSSSGPYHPIDDLSLWSTFDTSKVDPDAKGAAGAVFDGRYIYLVPLGLFAGATGYTLVRYDTQATFTDKTSWSVFKLGGISANADGFLGGVFDGQYVYLIPTQDTNGVVTRYDTKKPFMTTTSWSLYGFTGLSGNVGGFNGGTFDGRYVYLTPTAYSTALSYDTKGAGFAVPGSWSTLDMSQVVPSLVPDGGPPDHLDNGALSDGKHVYFFPQHGSLFQQYNLGGFTDPTNWLVFDTMQLAPDANHFTPGAFDGRYVYSCPSGPTSATVTHAWATQYDTTGYFTLAQFWSAFDTETLDPNAKGFNLAGFDGRYVYCVPGNTTILARFDTTGTFSTASSWATFDTKKAISTATTFDAAVFDGRYMYFASLQSGMVARFDARSPAAMPNVPNFHGSFY